MEQEQAQDTLYNFNGVQYKISSDFNGMENDVVNMFLAELATTQEVNPKKALIAQGLQGWIPLNCPDEEMMVWSWMKLGVQPTSCFHIKMVHLYPGVHPDDIYDCMTTEVRLNWDA